MANLVVIGDLCYSETPSKLRSVKDGYLVIENGVVEGLYRKLPAFAKEYEVLDYSGHLVIPGMSDLHIHAPQYQFRGVWMDMELIDWLNNHTFPEEAKYKDVCYADKAYDIFVNDLLETPTTRISAFSSLHKQATLLLMTKIEAVGIKGFVGKVNMDRNSPDILRERTQSSIADTLDYIKCAENFENVKPIITPRFIPSCTDELMIGLGKIAKEYNLPVQSHLSENLKEIEWVKELCPKSKSYADAYKQFGMWGETPTIMAHSVWSDTLDGELMFDENLFIAHCPDSNANLYSGACNAKYFLDKGARIGLGSDIAGGTSLYLTRTIVDAIHTSKLRYRLVDQSNGFLSFPEAFYLATVGGGAFFGKVGSFEKGYEADFVVLDEKGLNSTLSKSFTLEERLERYCYLSSEKPVLHKAVSGKLLF